MGVITPSVLHAQTGVCVCEGWRVNENARLQISQQIPGCLFIYSFENPGAPLSATFTLDAV